MNNTRRNRWPRLAPALLIALAVTLGACANNGSSSKPVADADKATAEGAPALKGGEAGADQWKTLFDGESLGPWKVTKFGGQGDVRVEDGRILLPFGNNLSGVTWKGQPPARMNYEIELKAQRVSGNDFFCGLTFPVGDDPCTLILGGWGGGVTGLSNINGYDASENNTSQWINYENKKWYTVRLRVTEKQIEAWLDDEKIVEVSTEGKEVSIRPEVNPSKPLGIASFQTTAALKDLRWRKVDGPADP